MISRTRSSIVAIAITAGCLFALLHWLTLWLRYIAGLSNAPKHLWWIGSLDCVIYGVGTAIAAGVVASRSQVGLRAAVTSTIATLVPLLTLVLILASFSGQPVGTVLRNTGRFALDYGLHIFVAVTISFSIVSALTRKNPASN